MGYALNNDIQQQARELARKITVAHDLDPEIQDELYAHIEDKLLAYKSGEEQISDEDAFILVREHFGDAKVIRGLMQEVHREGIRISMLRRVLALVVATSVFYIVLNIFSGMAQIGVALIDNDGDGPSRLLYQALIKQAFFPVAGTLLFLLLYRWKSMCDPAKLPWFGKWPLATLFGLAVVSTTLHWALPTITLFPSATSVGSDYEISLVQALGTLPLFAICTAWLWWTGSAKGGLVQLFGVGIIWALYSFGQHLGRATITIGSGELPDTIYEKLGKMEWSGVIFSYYTAVNRTTPYMLLSVLILWTFVAVLCTLFYYLGHRARQRWSPIDLASTTSR